MDPRFQNHVLDITVVDCTRLTNTEWFTKQDPYVSFEYGSAKFKTRTCPSGGTSPVFQVNFTLPLIEGLREIDVGVWIYHRLSIDNLIGSGKVQLQNVLDRGYDERGWTILTKSGRYAGEVKLIMRYSHSPTVIPPPPTTTVYPPPPSYDPPITVYPPPYGPSTPAYPPPVGPPNTAYPPPVGPRNTAYPPPLGPPNTAYAPPPPSAPPPPPHHHYGDPAGQSNRMYPGPPYKMLYELRH